MTIGRMLGVLPLCASLMACAAESDPSGLAEGDVTRGAALVVMGNCRSCHADDLAGSEDPVPDSNVYSSNITPDEETGIGLWSDKELDDLLRLGKSERGDAVCSPMPVYDSLSDRQVADMIAYLRSVPPVRRFVADSACQ